MVGRTQRFRSREAGRCSWRQGVVGIVSCVMLIGVGCVGVAEPAAAQAPTTTVLVPSNNATVSGTQVVLDASASSGATQVQFELNGGAAVIATATPTLYGWIALWNSTTLPNGTYSLQSLASADGVGEPSNPITITVRNPAPSTQVVLPADGASVSGSPYVDAVASAGVTQVLYEISGGPTNLVDLVISGSTPSLVGWVGSWNTGGVPNGSYILNSVASYADGSSGTSPPVTFVVSNPVTLGDLTQPNISGTGTAAVNVNGCSLSVAVNSSYEGGSSVAGIELQIAGCVGELEPAPFTGTFTVTTTNAGTLSGTASGSVSDNNPPDEVNFALTLTVTTATGSYAGTTGALQVSLSSSASAPPTDIPFTGSVSVS
jgi:hypothetical protein